MLETKMRELLQRCIVLSVKHFVHSISVCNISFVSRLCLVCVSFVSRLCLVCVSFVSRLCLVYSLSFLMSLFCKKNLCRWNVSQLKDFCDFCYLQCSNRKWDMQANFSQVLGGGGGGGYKICFMDKEYLTECPFDQKSRKCPNENTKYD